MRHATARRGRPKGTGIDDSNRIARLDELLRVRPDLKPTTAIRLMGYSDPSAIRRLRDKYKIYTTMRRTGLNEFSVDGASPAAHSVEPARPASSLAHLR
jgi:hypothetical protein